MSRNFKPVISTLALAAGMVAVVLSTDKQADAQVTLVHENRSLTVGFVQTDQTISAGPLASNVFLSNSTGAFSKGYNANSSGVQVSNGNDTAFATYNFSNSQNSLITSTGFSGTASMLTGGQIISQVGTWSSKGYCEDVYSVDFAVSSPTPFNLTGNITGKAAYHTGLLEQITGQIRMSSSAGTTPLYEIGFVDPNYSSGGLSINDPVSFNTVLEPGETYTLYAEASTNTNKIGDGAGIYSVANASFAFSASVPEPGSCTMLSLAVVLLGRKRRSLWVRPV